MKQYRFEKTIKVDGVLRTAGTVLPESEIPAGCLESMLRLGQVVPHDPTDPAERFAAAMTGAPVATEGRTFSEEQMREAVAEIERLRDALEGRSKQLTAMLIDLDAARLRVRELEAERSKPAPATETTDAKPEEKPAEAPEPTDAKAKPPVIGPSKPPELKAGKK